MSTQIVLAWSVKASESPLTPLQASVKLAAVTLYGSNPDSVLGQAGLAVSADSTSYDGGGAPPAWAIAPGAGEATRSILLNMTATAAPFAPPVFPAHPTTPTPPVLPYRLTRTVPLAGSFLVSIGSLIVTTTANQTPALAIGDRVQFATDPGVSYVIGAVASTTITLTTVYAGPFNANTTAAKVVAAPATIVGLYSTSPLDTNGVASTTPAIPAGSGCRVVSVSYTSSNGVSGTVNLEMGGKRVQRLPLFAGTIDVSIITAMRCLIFGAFENSVGQITLCELSAVPGGLPANPTPLDVVRLTDESQMLITRALAYMPPSYPSLAGQMASAPQLTGDFFVTTGSADVPTSEDHTGDLAAGNTITFAAQPPDKTPLGEMPPVIYTILGVTAKIVTLTTEFTGMGPQNADPNLNVGTRGSKSTALKDFPSGATKVSPTPAAPPTAQQLKTPLGGFVNPGLAVPPPDPAPVTPPSLIGDVGRERQPQPSPGVMSPTPTILSDIFTRTISLALAMPVTQEAIVLI